MGHTLAAHRDGTKGAWLGAPCPPEGANSLLHSSWVNDHVGEVERQRSALDALDANVQVRHNHPAACLLLQRLVRKGLHSCTCRVMAAQPKPTRAAT